METISVKGWKNGVLIIVPSAESWTSMVEQLESKLGEAEDFWKGALTTFDLGERELEEADLAAMLDKVREGFGLQPTSLVASHPETRELADKLGLEAFEKLPAQEKKEPDSPAVPESTKAPPHNALYLRQTIRSGQRIQHEGHLVICGDVNAGAELVACGDIVVFGTLRGVAHAGAQGDERARIVATNLRPTQLRIATRIARSPDQGTPPLSKFPEVALIEDGEIHINPL